MEEDDDTPSEAPYAVFAPGGQWLLVATEESLLLWAVPRIAYRIQKIDKVDKERWKQDANDQELGKRILRGVEHEAHFDAGDTRLLAMLPGERAHTHCTCTHRGRGTRIIHIHTCYMHMHMLHALHAQTNRIFVCAARCACGTAFASEHRMTVFPLMCAQRTSLTARSSHC